MSMKKRVLEITETYNKAKSVHKDWRKQLQTVISKFRYIANDIQELERSIKKRSIICSSVGWGSGLMIVAGIFGVPFTFGGSLSLTAVGTGIGICSGAADLWQRWAGNCGIKTKCNEAMALLKEITNLTTELANLVENLYTIQNVVCEMRNTGHISLGAAIRIGREPVVTLIPHIESTFVMFGGRTTGTVLAPIFGKVTTEFVKKSLRFVGTVAVGISIIADVVNIVNNVGALREGNLTDVVTAIYAAVENMENEKRRYDQMFAFTA